MVSLCPCCNHDFTKAKYKLSLNLRHNGKTDWMSCENCECIFSSSSGEIYNHTFKRPIDPVKRKIDKCPTCGSQISKWEYTIALDLDYHGKRDWVQCPACKTDFSKTDGEICKF